MSSEKEEGNNEPHLGNQAFSVFSGALDRWEILKYNPVGPVSHLKDCPDRRGQGEAFET